MPTQYELRLFFEVFKIGHVGLHDEIVGGHCPSAMCRCTLHTPSTVSAAVSVTVNENARQGAACFRMTDAITARHGEVYIGTVNSLVVYGLFPPINAAAGSGQTGTVATTLPNPLEAQIVNPQTGVGVSGVTVTFSVSKKGGTLGNSTGVTNAAGENWNLQRDRQRYRLLGREFYGNSSPSRSDRASDYGAETSRPPQ
jgi:hypothetical protein